MTLASDTHDLVAEAAGINAAEGLSAECTLRRAGNADRDGDSAFTDETFRGVVRGASDGAQMRYSEAAQSGLIEVVVPGALPNVKPHDRVILPGDDQEHRVVGVDGARDASGRRYATTIYLTGD